MQYRKEVLPVRRYGFVAANGRCGCVTSNRRIAEIEGRLIDSVVLSRGATQSPYTLTNAMGGIAGVVSYQIIQEKASRLLVRIVPDKTKLVDESDYREQISAALSRLDRVIGYQQDGLGWNYFYLNNFPA